MTTRKECEDQVEIGRVLTNQWWAKLERNLYQALREEGKTVSKNSMDKIIQILGRFGDFTEVEKNWAPGGFCYLYLRSANFDAELDDLREIENIDKEAGWFMGEEKLEEWIFAWKCLNIILNEKVRLKNILNLKNFKSEKNCAIAG